MSEKAKQRAEAHWDGYVGPMMRVMMDAAIEMSRFHYVTSHIHGVKHEQQDVQTPELSELLRRCGATTDPCTICLDEKKCGGGMRMANGQCLHHRRA